MSAKNSVNISLSVNGRVSRRSSVASFGDALERREKHWILGRVTSDATPVASPRWAAAQAEGRTTKRQSSEYNR